MLAFFLFVGLMFTLRTGVFQVTRFKYWIDVTLLQIFKKEATHVRKTDDGHAISQFQSLCTALAATIGVGNISGVAVALTLGGPGAIFWMWVSAFLGMMTSYAEKTLAIKYRYKNEKGDWIGGAMIYIEQGLGWKWLAVIFSLFCILASFGIGNMSQGNEIANGLLHSFGIPKWVTAIVAMSIAGLVIMGGIKRIASVSEKLVPLMALMYIAGALVVIFSNATAIPGAFAAIFGNAFNISSVGGLVPDISQIAYGTSKAAINYLTKLIAVHEAKHHIRCNAVLPGMTATEAVTQHLSDDFRALFLRHIPLGRIGLPEEIANAVVYFASDESAYTTGQILSVSGGFGLATPLYGELSGKAMRR
mgnify:CR=1 FL=1